MTGTLAHLALAAAAFVGSHFALSSTRLRRILAARLGEWPFIALYSTLAVALLAWLIFAYARAPLVELWPTVAAVRYLALAIIAFASVLLVGGYGVRNPTAVGQDRPTVAAEATGILRITRHPIMWAIGLWGLAHVAANGDAASLILFGSLGFLALAGTVLIDRKKRLTMGERWAPFAAATSNVPFAAVLAGRARVDLGEIGYRRLAAGLVLFLVLFFGHAYVIGVSPLG